ncbi:hypothetical protein [Brevibacillus reuszeri]|uniref:hypothetical protein n=1 Tax=Brevibacillus reuszeri TaxID=54915 RepID=UPI000CCC2D83|nr:hypothetical protein [Brevibacillus reuszeri]
MNHEESFSDEFYRIDDQVQDYRSRYIGYPYPSSSYYSWYSPQTPYYQPYGYDPFPYQYHPSQRGKGPGKGPGKRPTEEEAHNALYQIFVQMENETRQRPAFYSDVSGVQIQQRARIAWISLRAAVAIMRRMPLTTAQAVGGYLEGTVMASIGQAGTIAAAALVGRISDFLIHNFAAYASNPALATYRAEQIVNVISNLL